MEQLCEPVHKGDVKEPERRMILHRLAAAEEGCSCCQESTPKVISCHCFDLITKLTEDVQETMVEPEARGLEYEDKEVEAFCCSLIDRN